VILPQPSDLPRRYQSGQMDRQGRIHKRGPRLLRGALTEAAWLKGLAKGRKYVILILAPHTAS
jgi:transposase